MSEQLELPIPGDAHAETEPAAKANVIWIIARERGATPARYRRARELWRSQKGWRDPFYVTTGERPEFGDEPPISERRGVRSNTTDDLEVAQ